LLVSFVFSFFVFFACVFFAFVALVAVVSCEAVSCAKTGIVNENTMAAVNSKLSNFFIVGNPPWRLNYAPLLGTIRAKVDRLDPNVT
jgi:hypothetical protein